MRIRLLKVGTAFSMSLALCAVSVARGGDRLAWAFEPGEIRRYRLHLTSEAEVKATEPVDAVPKRSGVGLSLDLRWTVDRVAKDGTAEITQVVERARLTIRKGYAEDEEAAYDSADANTVDNPWSALMDMIFRPLLGEPIAMRLGRRGRLAEVEFPERTMKAWKDLPIRPGDGRDPFGAVFSGDGFLSVMATVLPELPADLPAEGGTWSHDWGVAGGPIGLTDRFGQAEHEGVTSRCVAETEVTLRRPEAAPLIPPPPIGYPMTLVSTEDVTYEGGRIAHQTGRATLLFDAVAGSMTEFSRELTYRAVSEFRTTDAEPRGGSATGSYRLVASLKGLPPRPTE